MLPLLLSIDIINFYCLLLLLSVLIRFLIHSTVVVLVLQYILLFCPLSVFCHRYLDDLASVLLVWLLTLLVHNFPCGDFIIN